MAAGQRSGLMLGQLQRLFSHGTVSGLSEGQLLARFVGERDEVAFEALVSRHGPMVLGICRRLLDDPHDVEDAFQATFLVLVKKARGLRDRELLANWLYGVALRVATRSRRDRTRRRSREREHERNHVPDHFLATTVENELGELRAELDAEVARLPAKFRTPIVLCYFEGLTHDQAAERLNCPVGTVRSRMAKGRELLRSRLVRRGLAPTPAPTFLVVSAVSSVSPSIPPALMVRTIATAMRFATGRSLTVAIASTSAIVLTQGVSRTMSLTRLMTFAASLLVLGGVGGGVGVAARQLGSGPAQKEANAQPAQPSANPARKALNEAQKGINEYEKDLKAAHAQIEKQYSYILALKARINALEAQVNEKARNEAVHPPGPRMAQTLPGGGAPKTASPDVGLNPDKPRNEATPFGEDVVGRADVGLDPDKPRNEAVHPPGPKMAQRPPGGGAAKTASPDDGLFPDMVTTAPGMIISRSQGLRTPGRVVIYATETGTARTYQPPPGTGVVWASPYRDYVFVAANGPEIAQLAVYDLKHDKWATQAGRLRHDG